MCSFLVFPLITQAKNVICNYPALALLVGHYPVTWLSTQVAIPAMRGDASSLRHLVGFNPRGPLAVSTSITSVSGSYRLIAEIKVASPDRPAFTRHACQQGIARHISYRTFARQMLPGNGCEAHGNRVGNLDEFQNQPSLGLSDCAICCHLTSRVTSTA